jgi:hypothetical protein
LSGHQSAVMKNDEWLTPPKIISALGEFDLDPCAPVVRPWNTAKWHYDKNDGKRLSGCAACAITVTALHLSRLALKQQCSMKRFWGGADAVLFIKGRPHFHRVDGSRAPFNSGAPISLVAYGSENVAALKRSGLGFMVEIKP